MGIAERGGKMRTVVVPNLKRKALQAEVGKHVEAGSALYAEALLSHKGLEADYAHQVIDQAGQSPPLKYIFPIFPHFLTVLAPARNVVQVIVETTRCASPRMIAKGMRLIKEALPFSIRVWLRRQELNLKHSLLPLRRVRDFGALRRVTPISKDFGWTRGTPIDRYYIEQFLSRNAGDIRGCVAEFQTDRYTRQFGAGHVTRSDVIDNAEGNPVATIVADIAEERGISSCRFDCVVCTQVLLMVYDFRSAIKTLYRILKPGSVLLLTVPGIGHKRIGRHEGSDYWRFTTTSVRRLFQEVFPVGSVEVQSYGNVLAAVALLHGLAVEEFEPAELEYVDPEYELSITVRAVKPNECEAG